MSLQPRKGRTLDTLIFDEGCAKTRVNELTQLFISKLQHDDLLKMVDKARRAFKPIPTFKLPEGKNREEVYGERARKLAEKVVEQERQNYVDARAEKDKDMIVEITRMLRFMVWTVDEKGKPTKLKLIVERIVRPTDQGGTHDIQYVGDHDFGRLHKISSLKKRLWQLKQFVPYYSKEIKKLYNEATYMGSLEYFHKKDEKVAGTQQKKEETEKETS